jgi:hypothetical protein
MVIRLPFTPPYLSKTGARAVKSAAEHLQLVSHMFFISSSKITEQHLHFSIAKKEIKSNENRAIVAIFNVCEFSDFVAFFEFL